MTGDLASERSHVADKHDPGRYLCERFALMGKSQQHEILSNEGCL